MTLEKKSGNSTRFFCVLCADGSLRLVTVGVAASFQLQLGTLQKTHDGMGGTAPWLPRRLRGYRLSEKILTLLRPRGERLLQGIEKLLRPRLALLSDVALLRMTSVVVLLMGVVMFLPLPFMNSLPVAAVQNSLPA